MRVDKIITTINIAYMNVTESSNNDTNSAVRRYCAQTSTTPIRRHVTLKFLDLNVTVRQTDGRTDKTTCHGNTALS